MIYVFYLISELFTTNLSKNWCFKVCLLQKDTAFVLMTAIWVVKALRFNIFSRYDLMKSFGYFFPSKAQFFTSLLFLFWLLSSFISSVKHNLYSSLVAFSHSLFSSSKFVTSSKECCCRVNLFKKLGCQIYRIFQEKNPQYTITLYNVENIVALRNCM